MYCLKERAKTFPELLEKAEFVLAAAPLYRTRKQPRTWMMYPVVY